MATRQVVINVPEKILLAEKTDKIGFGRDLRVMAAEVAGMTRAEFLLNLNRYRVFSFASELADLENGHITP